MGHSYISYLFYALSRRFILSGTEIDRMVVRMKSVDESNSAGASPGASQTRKKRRFFQ